MTKPEIKALCEDDPGLQWWAMIMFAEIIEVAAVSDDKEVICSVVWTKVREFPKLIIQRQLEKIKEAAEKIKTQKESIK